jgi:hypothetical protein
MLILIGGERSLEAGLEFMMLFDTWEEVHV